uniref:Uncharacterized protein n=1 Tax=Arundo donax TaxID=35708 RepID=A0A0A9DJ50_ARUDO
MRNSLVPNELSTRTHHFASISRTGMGQLMTLADYWLIHQLTKASDVHRTWSILIETVPCFLFLFRVQTSEPRSLAATN